MLKRKFIEIGSAVYRNLIFPFVRIYLEITTKSVLRQKSYIYKGTVLRGKNYVGQRTTLANVDLGYGTNIIHNCAVSNTVFGKYCTIGENFKVAIGRHPTHYVALHPGFYAPDPRFGYSYVKEHKYPEEVIFLDKEKKIQIKVGNDVWTGADVTVVQGVTIGDGCVIGTNSLILSDLEPYGIYAGSPAKLIRKRFTDEQIEKLLEIKWWDKDESWIKENIDKFTNVDEFIEAAGHADALLSKPS